MGNEYAIQDYGEYSTVGYTTDGWRIVVTVKMYAGDEPGEGFKRLHAEVTAAGLQLNPAGIDDGQQIETIHFVCKRIKYNDDGTETPVIGMYTDWGNYKWQHEYLNTNDDVTAFEDAAQVKVNALPTWIADSFPQRNTGNKKADAHIVQVVPFRVVREQRGEVVVDGKTYPKWKVLRYEPLVSNGSAPEATAKSQAKAQHVQVSGNDDAAPFNAKVVSEDIRLSTAYNDPKHVRNTITKHFKAAGFGSMNHGQAVAWLQEHAMDSMDENAPASFDDIPF